MYSAVNRCLGYLRVTRRLGGPQTTTWGTAARRVCPRYGAAVGVGLLQVWYSSRALFRGGTCCGRPAAKHFRASRFCGEKKNHRERKNDKQKVIQSWTYEKRLVLTDWSHRTTALFTVLHGPLSRRLCSFGFCVTRNRRLGRMRRTSRPQNSVINHMAYHGHGTASPRHLP